MDKNNSISFKKVSKYYDEFKALNNMSFDIPSNSVVGLIGANGSGKTTMIKCLLNMYTDYSGEIEVFGNKSNTIGQSDNIFSYIPDTPVYYEELTASEHFDFISKMYQTEEMVSPLVKYFELDKHLHKFPHELSKGNLQKIIICCALLRNYKILLSDEPFSALDPKQIKNLKQKFLELKTQDKTVIISTHLLRIIEDICDYYIMIDDGKLIGAGPLDEIIKNAPDCNNLEELYLHLSYNSEGINEK